MYTLFQDCHGKNVRLQDDTFKIIKDDTQNYVIEREGYQNMTHTIITFKRALETCDPRDVPLTSCNSIKLFWGYGEQDVIPNQLNKINFKAKNTKMIHMLNPSFKISENDFDVKHWDATVSDVSVELF